LTVDFSQLGIGESRVFWLATPVSGHSKPCQIPITEVLSSKTRGQIASQTRAVLDWQASSCGELTALMGRRDADPTIIAAANRLSAPAFWVAPGDPASRDQRGRSVVTGRASTTLIARAAASIVAWTTDFMALPAECPVPICARGAALPEDRSCTNTDPAHPGGAPLPCVLQRPRPRQRQLPGRLRWS